MSVKIDIKQYYFYFLCICLLVLLLFIGIKMANFKEGQTTGPATFQGSTQSYQNQLLSNLDTKIKNIQTMLDNLDKTLPQRVRDIKPGKITTISYEDAVKPNAVSPITIHVSNTQDPDTNKYSAQWTIDMQIPLGPKGDKGDKGPLGAMGKTGAKGPRGDDGLRGNWWNSNSSAGTSQ
jgi:hypothetical protein